MLAKHVFLDCITKALDTAIFLKTPHKVCGKIKTFQQDSTLVCRRRRNLWSDEILLADVVLKSELARSVFPSFVYDHTGISKIILDKGGSYRNESPLPFDRVSYIRSNWAVIHKF
jgi:hypothetical protein